MVCPKSGTKGHICNFVLIFWNFRTAQKESEEKKHFNCSTLWNYYVVTFFVLINLFCVKVHFFKT